MLIDLTVSTSRGGARELTLESSAPVGGDVVAGALREALDLSPADRLVVDGVPVDDALQLGSPPLIQGAALLVRPPALTGARASARPPSPLVLAVTSGPDAGGEVALRHGTTTIGRAASADLTLADGALSRVHAEVLLDTGGARIRDRGTTNGTTVDGTSIADDWTPLHHGSAIVMGHHRLEARSAVPHRPCTTQPTGEGHLAVTTSPSIEPTPPQVTVTFPERPGPPARRQLPWVMILLPLPVALLMAVLIGPRMMVFALMSPVLVLGNHVSDRMSRRSESARALEEWRREMRRERARLDLALAEELRCLRRAHPDAHEVGQVASLPSTRLWERRREHGCHLAVRAGTGQVPAQVEVRRGPGDRPRPRLTEAPVVIDLDAEPVVGVTGDPDAVTRWVRWYLAQLLVLHPPSDLRLVLVGTRHRCTELAWAPHVEQWDVEELAGLVDEGSAPDTADPSSQTTLVVLDDPASVREDPSWRRVLSECQRRGLSVLVSADVERDLPHECTTLVSLRDGVGDLADRRRRIDFAPDGVSSTWGTRVGRALAPLRDATPTNAGSALADRVALLGVLDIQPTPDALREQWEQTSSWRVPVGVSADATMHLDLLGDGPHALVGGTTGSGKSELLQTWICSLAARLGPRDLNLVLVDYKGGSAFASCAQLPHTVGLLTDLDPAGARRALTSLDAELRRRERLLAEHGASDIDAVHDLGIDLPRLVIAVDEFRMLAEEQPEVLRDLVRLAALGRSLGIHLILATQRPGGVITPEIRANVSLRIALRVRDRSDSEDVIAAPDAAAIAEGLPGRAYVRTGGAPPVAFQCAYGGEPQSEDPGLRVLARDGSVLLTQECSNSPAAELRGPTDIEAVVVAAREAFAASGLPMPHRPWLPPLPAMVEEGLLLPAAGEVVWGLADRPHDQRQESFGWTPQDGAWAIVGGPGSGRTTALLSLLTRADRDLDTPVVSHLVTASPLVARRTMGPRACGSVVDLHDAPAVRQLAERAETDADERRLALHDSGFPTYGRWRAAWTRGDAPPPPPVLLLLIDGWAELTARSGPEDAAAVAALTRVARDGSDLGICAVVAGGRELLVGGIAGSFRRRLVLDLPDRADLLSAGLRSPDASAPRPPGRCFVMPEGVLAQLAMPVSGADAPDVTSRQVRGPWGWTIEPLPPRVSLDALASTKGEVAGPGVVLLGHSGETGRPATVDLRGTGSRWTVVGPSRSGRSSALRLAGAALASAGRPLIVVATGETDPLVGHATHRVEPDELDALVDLIRGEDAPVVLIDDVERLEGTPVEAAVRELARPGAAPGVALLTSTSAVAAGSIRGLSAALCRSRHGLLLQPWSRADGECFGVRVPASPRLPGRGYLVADGAVSHVQVAYPEVPALLPSAASSG